MKSDNTAKLFAQIAEALGHYMDILLELPEDEHIKEYVSDLSGMRKRLLNFQGNEIVDRSEVMREMGSRGGKRGGVARAKLLTPEQRRKIAQIAAKARWRK